MYNIAIVGGGSWATALVKILTQKISKINWFIRRPEVIEHILKYNHNPDYLSYIHLNPNQLKISDDLKFIIEESEIIFWAIPSAFIHQTIDKYNLDFLDKKLHISVIKGIIPELNYSISEYLNNYYKVPYNNIGVLAGPCHAEEVAMQKMSILTLATSNSKLEAIIPELLTNRFLKVKISNDLKGVEYSSIIKNIYAIVAGIAIGLGYGDNFLSILVSQSMKEARYFLETLIPTKRDILDSVYTGDILVTAYSQFSRNRMFGSLIGKGYSIQYSLIEMKMVAEGYYATKRIFDLARELGLHTPIIDCAYNILYRNSPAFLEMKILADHF